MNLFDRLSTVYNTWLSTGQKTQTVERPSTWQQAQAAAEVFNPPDMGLQDNQLSLYNKLTWIQIAVNTVSQYAAANELNVKKVSGEDETDVKNHPFEMLLRRPNPLQSRFEFLEATFSYYKLLGNSFWWLNKSSEHAAPAEIWVMPANRMRPVPDKNLYLKGYIYTSDWGQEVPLELWEVVHFKRFNPTDPFNGLSAMEALGMDSQADLEASKWNAKLWGKNNGRLSSVLTFPENYTDEQWGKMQSDVADSANKRNIMMIRNVKQNGIQWLQNTMSQKDMEFLGGRNFTKEEIFATLAKGLASMLAINATEANAKTGKATLAELEIWPMHTAIAEKITNDILPDYGDNLRAEFDDVRMTDRSLEIQETEVYSKFHSIDETRKFYYNDDPMEDNEAGKLLVAQVGERNVLPAAPAQVEGNAGATQTPPAVEPVIPSNELQPTSNAETPIKAELGRWMRKSIKALKNGRTAGVSFESELIPDAKRGYIESMLPECHTPEAVKAVFEEEPERIDPLILLLQELRLDRLALEDAK